LKTEKVTSLSPGRGNLIINEDLNFNPSPNPNTNFNPKARSTLGVHSST